MFVVASAVPKYIFQLKKYIFIFINFNIFLKFDVCITGIANCTISGKKLIIQNYPNYLFCFVIIQLPNFGKTWCKYTIIVCLSVGCGKSSEWHFCLSCTCIPVMTLMCAYYHLDNKSDVSLISTLINFHNVLIVRFLNLFLQFLHWI